MESSEAKIRKITAAWRIEKWYIANSQVFIHFNGVWIGFDLTAAELPELPKPTEPLNLVLEIPCQASPSTNPTNTPSS